MLGVGLSIAVQHLARKHHFVNGLNQLSRIKTSLYHYVEMTQLLQELKQCLT